MKQLIVFFLSIFLLSSTNAQLLQRTEIRLNGFMGSQNSFEFSSLAQDSQSIYLVPALKGGATPIIYKLRRTALDSVTNSEGDTKNVDVSESILFDPETFRRYILSVPKYDGIEACVIRNDSIWFSIESNSDTCYIALGVIGKSRNAKIIRIMNSRPIAKPSGKFSDEPWNDGFESMAFLHDSLLLFFERKDTLQNKCFVFLIDPTLAVDPVPVYINGMFKADRLADICVSADGRALTGITMTYDPAHPELDLYQLECFNGAAFISADTIHSGNTDLVWEGIIAYRDGYLLINDNDNSKGRNIFASQLLYVTKRPIANPR